MDDNYKLLQILVDGQKEIKEELIVIKSEINGVEKNLTKRIDKLGLQLAELEDDSPTREEHDELEARVTKVETKLHV